MKKVRGGFKAFFTIRSAANGEDAAAMAPSLLLPRGEKEGAAPARLRRP